MLESELFHVKAIYEGVDESDRVFFVNVLVDGVGKSTVWSLWVPFTCSLMAFQLF